MLCNQMAYDDGGYGFFKDIERIQNIVSAHEDAREGYVIFITNDDKYLSAYPGKSDYYEDFWINEYVLGKNCSETEVLRGTVNGDEKKVTLRGNFKVGDWVSQGDLYWCVASVSKTYTL
jgi:hypothetical protein